MCFLSLRERHVSSQFDDFSQLIHLSFTNVHRLIASRSLCSLCALILPRQTPFHFHSGQQDRLPGTHIQTCMKNQILIAGSCDDGEVCSRLCSRYPESGSEHQKSCARTHPREHTSSHTVRGWDLATVRDFVQAVDGEGRHGVCH